MDRENPELILRRYGSHRGACRICSSFSPLYALDNINFYCEECFRMQYQGHFRKDYMFSFNEEKKKESERKQAEYYQKRHAKGHAFINLRAR